LVVEIVRINSGSTKSCEVVFDYRKSWGRMVIDEICSRIPGIEILEETSCTTLTFEKAVLCEFRKINGVFWCFSDKEGLPVDRDTARHVLRWICAAIPGEKSNQDSEYTVESDFEALFSPIPDEERVFLSRLLNGTPAPSAVKAGRPDISPVF